MEEFEKLCHRQGLPLTVQRRAVLEALMRRHDHPTADALFADVSARLPGISRPTVYRTLDALVEIGIARKVCHPGAAARFEVQSHRHHHLVCLGCGRMVDLEDPRLDNLPFPGVGAQGFEVHDYSIQFRGTCADCLRAAASKRKRRGQKKSRRAAATLIRR